LKAPSLISETQTYWGIKENGYLLEASIHTLYARNQTLSLTCCLALSIDTHPNCLNLVSVWT
jgi:hypothetical protein